MKNRHRYFLFSWSNYEAYGGFMDYNTSSDELVNLVGVISQSKRENHSIYDTYEHRHCFPQFGQHFSQFEWKDVEKMKNRYLVFVYEAYYPAGGTNDIQFVGRDLEPFWQEIRGLVMRGSDVEIIDMETGTCTYVGHECYSIENLSWSEVQGR